jgi:DNA-directed RNA polymerase I, II, and III subunit RPABC1
MLKDRMFLVRDDILKITYDQFKEIYKNKRDNLSIISIKEGTDEKIAVFFNSIEKPRAKELLVYINECERKQISHCIVIVKNQLSSVAKQAIVDIAAEFQLESFEEKELLINITKHELVPKHELLSPKDKKELLLRYKINDIQLPRILMSDPISRYYGLKRGDVFKITRNSETAGQYVT